MNTKLADKVDKIPRKKLRYVMFRIKSFEEEGQSLDGVPPSMVDMVKEYFGGQDGFTSWKGFTVDWDLGIDDTFTMSVREDKWWLYGLPKTMVVKRGNRTDSKEDGLIHFESLGLVEYVGDGEARRPRYNFKAIMEFTKPQRERHYNLT